MVVTILELMTIFLARAPPPSVTYKFPRPSLPDTVKLK